MTALDQTRPCRRCSLVLAAAMTVVALVILTSLGFWQLDRLAWKEGLIATLNQRLAMPPMPLPPPLTWSNAEPGQLEFRRVTFPAEFIHEHEALVYAGASSPLRPDVSGPGYWVFTPARLLGGSVVMVNRGFIPEARKDPASRREGQLDGVIDIAGALRWPEAAGTHTPAAQPTSNLWFNRDHLAIAEAKGLGRIAPFYIEQAAPPAPGGLPKVGPIAVNLRNNHLQYAVTWFGLALSLLAVFTIWAIRRPR